MLIITSDVHRAHHCLELDGATLIRSWESPERADIVHRTLIGQARHRFDGPATFDVELAGEVHDPAYVAFLQSAWGRWLAAYPDTDRETGAAMGFAWTPARSRRRMPSTIDGLLGHYSFAADCSIVAGTWDAVSSSAAIAQTTARAVSAGEPYAFGLCRPPGHHATIDQFGGYCYLNNAAIAAQSLRNDGAGRVAVLDIDYHHGNGTQDIFWHRDDVLFGSIHADPTQEFPWSVGHADEIGAAAGSGWNRNRPLPWGTNIHPWLDALDDLTTWVTNAGCDALVLSVGLDTFVDDPISRFALHTGDYPIIGQRLRSLGLPTVLLLEGGYATDALGTNCAALLDGFEGVTRR